MLRKRNCEICKKNFLVKLPPSREKSGRGRFCSIPCKIQWTKGQRFSKSTEFKKGTKMVFSKKHRENLSNALRGKKNALGKINGKWKGNDVGYFGLHSWVRRQLGKPSVCIKCNQQNKVQWANKSHKYKRDIKDWVSLCYWCHRKYDRKKGWGIATKMYSL